MAFPKKERCRSTYTWDLSGDTNTTATGTIPFFSAPAACLIHSVSAYVVTAITGSSAEEVGDGTDVDGFLADGFAAVAGYYPLYNNDVATTFVGAFQFDSTAGATDAADVAITPKKKLYASADTIDFKISGTATAGKVIFTVDFEVLA